MKFLMDRLFGTYRYRYRVLAPLGRKRILEGLERDEFSDPAMQAYLRFWLPYLKNRKRVGDLSVFVGTGLARKIYGMTKDDLTPTFPAGYESLKPWFDAERNVFDFNGIRLVPAKNPTEGGILALTFADILLGWLLGAGYDAIIDAISTEGDYERGPVRLESGDMVIDCGANMGMFSALATRRGCEALAFEPMDFIREAYLEPNAALNPTISIAPLALSDRRETLEFHINDTNIGGCARDDSRSESARMRAPGAKQTVEAVTLDSFVEERAIDKIDFIKADIEGSERKMLAGAKNVLRKHAPKLSICTYHLPDDPTVLRQIILECQPHYTVHQGAHKLYAHVEGR